MSKKPPVLSESNINMLVAHIGSMAPAPGVGRSFAYCDGFQEARTLAVQAIKEMWASSVLLHNALPDEPINARTDITPDEMHEIANTLKLLSETLRPR